MAIRTIQEHAEYSCSEHVLKCIVKKLPTTGIEPATIGLKVQCSTTELRRLYCSTFPSNLIPTSMNPDNLAFAWSQLVRGVALNALNTSQDVIDTFMYNIRPFLAFEGREIYLDKAMLCEILKEAIRLRIEHFSPEKFDIKNNNDTTLTNE